MQNARKQRHCESVAVFENEMEESHTFEAHDDHCKINSRVDCQNFSSEKKLTKK